MAVLLPLIERRGTYAAGHII